MARGDLAGGLTAALVLPAVEGGYGLIAYGPLGPDLVHIGFLLGAFAAAVASIVSMLAGGRGPLLSGSGAALALLMSSLVGTLVADPRFLGADGRPFLPLILAFAGLGVVLAGAIQVTEATKHALGEAFRFDARGALELKGRGAVRAWLLLGENGGTARPATEAS